MSVNSYTPVDLEIISLASVWDLIGSMVHYGHLMDHSADEPILMFHTTEARHLFLIRLADFLSLPGTGTLGMSKPLFSGSLGKSYLGHLRQVVDNPQFTGDISQLNSAVAQFADWLDGEIVVKDVWFPTIEYSGPVRVNRLEYLKICGNISKHGFTRLTDVVRRLRKIMADNGRAIDEGESYLLISDFKEKFRDDIYIAAVTAIAWYLNEIRWGIYTYLKSEFQRSYTPAEVIHGARMYEYDIPAGVSNMMVKWFYWGLMNDMRGAPYFPRFTLNKFVRENY